MTIDINVHSLFHYPGDPDDIRKMSSTLNTLANEKTKLLKVKLDSKHRNIISIKNSP